MVELCLEEFRLLRLLHGVLRGGWASAQLLDGFSLNCPDDIFFLPSLTARGWVEVKRYQPEPPATKPQTAYRITGTGSQALRLGKVIS